jgi:hypothetical protein
MTLKLLLLAKKMVAGGREKYVHRIGALLMPGNDRIKPN